MEIEVLRRVRSGSHAATGALLKAAAADFRIDSSRCPDMASVDLAGQGSDSAPTRLRLLVEPTRRPAPARRLARSVAAIVVLSLSACGEGPYEVDAPGTPVINGGEELAEKAPQAQRWDADGDGNQDISWWNSTTGDTTYWRMLGNTLLGSGSLGGSPVRPFSRRTNLVGDSCTEFVYRAGNFALINVPVLNPLVVGCFNQPNGVFRFDPPGWTLIDVEGRYDGGSRNHMLWRNTEGTVAIWSLGAGGTIAASGFPATAPLEWAIVDGRGDYDGDGRSDILWRNSVGTVAMWRMTSISAIAGTVFFGTAPTATWTLADAAGDYDGNGRSDLLWIDRAGSVVIWNLNPANGSFTAAPVGNVGTGWRVLDGSVDFDNDRKSDIVLQGPAGEVVMWLMNGATIKSSRLLGTVGAEWRMVARNAP
jgi:hypothetical protein